MGELGIVIVVGGGVLVLLALGVPIGVVLGLAGVAGIIGLIGDIGPGVALAGLIPIGVTSTYSYIVVPMFLLMGALASATGLSGEIFDAAYKNLGRLPGGLAVATAFASAGFGAVTGSSVAATMAMGKLALPEMRKFNYKPVLSAGVIASSGTFAMMIPPSIMLVVYAIFTDQSVGKMLLAGAIPGLITAVVYSLQIMLRVLKNPSLGPRGQAFHWKDKIVSLKSVIPFLIVLLAILAGILFGLWTPTEAGAGGVLLVIAMGLIRRRMGGRALLEGIEEAVVASASVFVLVIGALLFSGFLALSGVTEQLTTHIVNLDISLLGLFLILMAFYILLGCILEGMSMMALTIPLVFPTILTLGWNPIWFGIIFVKLVEIAQVTPPVGLNLYVMKSVAPDIPIATIYLGCLPFWLCDVAVLTLLYFVPQLALWLPNMMIT